MSDLRQRIQAATALIKPEWSDRHAGEVEQSFRRRARRRQRFRAAGGVGAAVAFALSLAFALSQGLLPRRSELAATPVADGVLHFADGSLASPLGESSLLRVSSLQSERVVVAVDRGGGRFVVAKNPRRVFRVEAGAVAIEVLGTRFAVAHAAAQVRVTVEEGRVRVLWAAQSRELAAGEEGLFPAKSSAPPVEERAEGSSAATSARPARRLASSEQPVEPAQKNLWRELAEKGEYDGAYQALKDEHTAPIRDEPAELLLAADVARLSHHPAEALSPLRKLLDGHAEDPRAPLAAFTLGRVLLEELGQPNEAARAFSQAEELAPGGLLASDSIAREVEAWSRAGETARARQRAEEYLRRYPDGSRVRSVRRFGGLE